MYLGIFLYQIDKIKKLSWYYVSTNLYSYVYQVLAWGWYKLEVMLKWTDYWNVIHTGNCYVRQEISSYT